MSDLASLQASAGRDWLAKSSIAPKVDAVYDAIAELDSTAAYLPAILSRLRELQGMQSAAFASRMPVFARVQDELSQMLTENQSSLTRV